MNYKVIGGDNKPYGPVSDEELRRWIAEGRLNAKSFVMPEGATEWQALDTLPEFAEAFGAGAQSATPPPITTGVPSGEGDVNIGDCLAAGFRFAGSNFGFVAGTVLMMQAITGALSVLSFFIPFLPGLALFILNGVLQGGLFYAWLRRGRGEPVGVGNMFDGFKLCFLQLMLAGVVSHILTVIGMVFCFLPGLYLSVAWCFALPLVADRKLEFWTAMEASRKAVTRVWFKVFALLLIAFLPMIVVQVACAIKAATVAFGIFQQAQSDPSRLLQVIMDQFRNLLKLGVLMLLVQQVVLFFNMLFAFGAIVRAYETLLGARKS